MTYHEKQIFFYGTNMDSIQQKRHVIFVFGRLKNILKYEQQIKLF